jgi:DNA-directed RNA polymerase specialized sigma24 family protein
MNSIVSWIAAEAELPKPPDGLKFPLADLTGEVSADQDVSKADDLERPEVAEDPLDRNPELRTYRGRTIGMLRRYLRFSLETGRLPSLLGREFFRTRVTSYSVGTFEDRVILVHDMEICLQRLSEFSRQLLARYILQEHDLPATARLLHCNEKTIRRTIPIALDELSEILLDVGLLESQNSVRQKSCQGGKTDEFPASDCKEGANKRGYAFDAGYAR